MYAVLVAADWSVISHSTVPVLLRFDDAFFPLYYSKQCILVFNMVVMNATLTSSQRSVEFHLFFIPNILPNCAPKEWCIANALFYTNALYTIMYRRNPLVTIQRFHRNHAHPLFQQPSGDCCILQWCHAHGSGETEGGDDLLTPQTDAHCWWWDSAERGVA